MRARRMEKRGKRHLRVWGVIAFLVTSILLILGARVVIAEVKKEKDTSHVYAQAKPKDRYVYDTDSGKWVKESELESKVEVPREILTTKEKTPEARINEYLVKARKSLAIYDFFEASEYARRALEIDDNNFEAQSILSKVEEARIEHEAELARSELEKRAQEEKAYEERISEDIPEAKPLTGPLDKDYDKEAQEEARKAEMRAEEEAQRQAEEEAKRLAEARKAEMRAEEEAQRQAEEEAKRLAEARKAEMRAEEEAQRQAEEEAKRLAEARKAEMRAEEESRQKAEKAIRLAEAEEAEIRSGKETSITRKQLEEKAAYLDQARIYAEKALAMGDDSPEAKGLLASIERAEKARREDLERLIREEEARRQAEEEAQRKLDEARAAQERAEKIEGYLSKAQDYLERDKYERARSYTEKALQVDAGSEAARLVLTRIDNAEKAYQAELERLRQEMEAQRQAEEEAKRKAEEARAAEKRADKITAYLNKSQDYVTKDKYEKARSYARKALEVEPDNEAARGMLSKIDDAENAYQEELEKMWQEMEAQKQAEEEAKRKAEEARAAEKRADKIGSHLSGAQRYLDKDNYEKARDYARRALEIDPESEPARQMLAQIDNTEKTSKEELERYRLDQEAQRQAEKEVEEAQRLEDERTAYLEQARSYAKQAVESGDDSPEAKELLASIERTEKVHQEELERARQEEEAKRQAEEEARRKQEEETRQKTEEENRQKHEQKIQGYLNEANKNIQADNFTNARKYVRKVLDIDKNYPGAMDLLLEIDRQEGLWRESNSSKSVQKTREKADQAAREGVKKEAVRKSKDEKIRKDIHEAREYLSQGNYKEARKYAYKAWEKIPHDTEVAVLIADINKEEIFGPSGLQKKDREDDPIYRHDEKPLLDYVTEIFHKKTYDLDESLDDPNKIYTLDECVKIAMHQNQRIKVADEQVKLAEMRVWEKRRDLFPDLSFKREWSTGKINSGGFNRHYKGQKYQFEIKHEIFDGFKTWNEVRQNQVNLEIIKLEKGKILNEITEETKKAYYHLDKAVKGVEVQKNIVVEINSLYDIADKAYQQDLVSRVEFLKVKGQYLQADFQQVSSKEDVSLAEMVLFQAMNMDPPDHHINIEPIERPERLLSIGLQNCYNLAMANRPDFKIKEKTIEYYEFERKMAKASGWPKVEFTSSIGESYERFEPLMVGPPGGDQASTAGESSNPMTSRTWLREWYAGVKTTIPFWGNTIEHNYVREFWAPTISSFRGAESATNYLTVKFLDDLKYFSTLQESRVGFERSKYEYMKARKDLLVEVKEKYFKYRKALLQMNVSIAQVEHQKMFVDVLEERRGFGEMELSRIVDEYVKLGENEYGTLQGDADYYVAIAELNKAIGVPDYFDPWQEDKRFEEWREVQTESDGPGSIEDIRTSADRATSERNERIAEFLDKARNELDGNKFSGARNYTIKALELNGNNMEARDLLGTIDNAEGLYRENKTK